MQMSRMKARRLERGMTQVVLAYRARVAPTDISKFENGRAMPYPKQAARLARVLELEAAELLSPVTWRVVVGEVAS